MATTAAGLRASVCCAVSTESSLSSPSPHSSAVSVSMSQTFVWPSSSLTASSPLPSSAGRLNTAFLPSLPSSFPSSSSSSSSSFSRKLEQRRNVIVAISPGFYKIPVYPGVPVGSTLKLYNMPYDVDRQAVLDHFKSCGADVESLEINNNQEENNAHGVITLGNLDQACVAVAQLDGAKFQGKCLRMDFVTKRPYDPEPTRRSRMNRSYNNNYSSGPNSYSSGPSSYSSGPSSYSSGPSSGPGGYSSGPSSGPGGYSSGPSSGPGGYSSAPGGYSSGPSSATGGYGGGPGSYGGGPSSYGGGYGRGPSMASSNRIYVGNLPWSIDDSGLQQLFAAHGTVEDSRIVKDMDTGRSRGFGFVSMSSPAEMEKAIAALDGREVEGRRLRVNVASGGGDGPRY